MWLKEKKYTISVTDQDSVLTKEDLIKVKLNGIVTTIELNQLFAKISGFEFKERILVIEGWSILQNLKDNNFIIDGNSISVSFETESGIHLQITSVKNPIVIWNDIELIEEEISSINNKLLELSIDNSEQETVTEEEPHSLPPVFVNEKYESGKLSLIKKGYVEYKEGNYRFLLDETNGKSTLIEILSEDKFAQLQNGEKIVDNFYKFKDDKNNSVINVKLIGDELIVEPELIGEIEPIVKEDEVEL